MKGIIKDLFFGPSSIVRENILLSKKEAGGKPLYCPVREYWVWKTSQMFSPFFLSISFLMCSILLLAAWKFCSSFDEKEFNLNLLWVSALIVALARRCICGKIQDCFPNLEHLSVTDQQFLLDSFCGAFLQTLLYMAKLTRRILL